MKSSCDYPRKRIPVGENRKQTKRPNLTIRVKTKPSKGEKNNQNQGSNIGRRHKRGGQGAHCSGGSQSSYQSSRPNTNDQNASEYCDYTNHPESHCWYKTLRKTTEALRKENRHLIEHFRVKDAKRKQLVLANPGSEPFAQNSLVSIYIYI